MGRHALQLLELLDIEQHLQRLAVGIADGRSVCDFLVWFVIVVLVLAKAYARAGSARSAATSISRGCPTERNNLLATRDP